MAVTKCKKNKRRFKLESCFHIHKSLGKFGERKIPYFYVYPPSTFMSIALPFLSECKDANFHWQTRARLRQAFVISSQNRRHLKQPITNRGTNWVRVLCTVFRIKLSLFPPYWQCEFEVKTQVLRAFCYFFEKGRCRCYEKRKLPNYAVHFLHTPRSDSQQALPIFVEWKSVHG